MDVLEPQYLITYLGQDENNPILTTSKPLWSVQNEAENLPAIEVREDLNISVMLHFPIKGVFLVISSVYTVQDKIFVSQESDSSSPFLIIFTRNGFFAIVSSSPASVHV